MSVSVSVCVCVVTLWGCDGSPGKEEGVRENGHMTHQQHGGVPLGSDAGGGVRGGGDMEGGVRGEQGCKGKEKEKDRGFFSAVAPPAGHLRSKAISMC